VPGVRKQLLRAVEDDVPATGGLERIEGFALHPEMLGRNFQALALGKDFRETLSGFHFGRDPAAALGL